MALENVKHFNRMEVCMLEFQKRRVSCIEKICLKRTPYLMVFTVCIVCTSSSFAVSSNFSSSSPKTNATDAYITKDKKMAKINDVINKLDPYVKYNNATNKYFIDVKKLPKTITKSEIRIANRIISDTNQNSLIKSYTHDTVVRAKKKRGVTKLVLRWYGYDLYLSHIACNRLYKHHSLPATIVAVIHPIAAAEVVAWAYLIHTVDKGKGVIVKLVRTGPMLNPVWVRRQ